jgi:hypothetical protein
MFELAKEEAGKFDVEISGLKGTFVVKEPSLPLELYAVTIISVATVAGIAMVLYKRKRAKQTTT